MLVSTVDRTIAISVANGVAVLSTCFRLIHRTTKSRLWWDDFWAFVSLLFVIGQWVASVDIPSLGNPLMRLWIISYQVLYNFSLWTARLSLAVTIVRLCPQGAIRNVSKVAAVAFGACCVALTVWRTIVCSRHGNGEFCTFDTPSAAVETAVDLLADAWLIGAPIHMLFRMRLPGRHLRMLVAIFTLNILTSVACVVHAVFRQQQWVQVAIITGNIQSAISLFVCNLLVLVTFLYRSIRGGEQATSVSEQTETVTHSVPQAADATSLRDRLPPGARIEMTDISDSCHCSMCKYLHEQLQETPSLRSIPSLGGRITQPKVLRPDPNPDGAPRATMRVPSEKSLGSLRARPSNLSPTSTFPDLPVRSRRSNNNKDSRRVPSEKSVGSLIAQPYNLSNTSTFPDLFPDPPERARHRQRHHHRHHSTRHRRGLGRRSRTYSQSPQRHMSSSYPESLAVTPSYPVSLVSTEPPDPSEPPENPERLEATSIESVEHHREPSTHPEQTEERPEYPEHPEHPERTEYPERPESDHVPSQNHQSD